MKIKYKIAAFVLISGALILLINNYRPFPKSSKNDARYFWAHKTHGEQTAHIVFGGDSRIYRGVNPASFGSSALNLGYSAQGYSNKYMDFVEDHLNEKKPTIVLGISPYSLTPKACLNEHLESEQKRSSYDIFQILSIEKHLRFLEPIRPSEIKNAMQNNDKGYHEHFHENGWVASNRFDADTNRTLLKYRDNFTDNMVSDSVIHLLSERVKKWTKAGIQVFAFRPPSSISMEDLENEISGYDELRMEEVIFDCGGIWLEINNNYHSYDGSHLSKRAAMKFSNELNAKIEAIQATQQQ